MGPQAGASSSQRQMCPVWNLGASGLQVATCRGCTGVLMHPLKVPVHTLSGLAPCLGGGQGVGLPAKVAMPLLEVAAGLPPRPLPSVGLAARGLPPRSVGSAIGGPPSPLLTGVRWGMYPPDSRGTSCTCSLALPDRVPTQQHRLRVHLL